MVVDPAIRSAVITEEHQTRMVAGTASFTYHRLSDSKGHTLPAYKLADRMYRHSYTRNWQGLDVASE